MTFTGIIALIYAGLLLGFVVASWRRSNPNWRRDVWWLSLGLLAIAVPRATLTPEPARWGRISGAVAITVWLVALVVHWRQSGVPCRIRGHEWEVCAETTTGSSVRISVPTPEMEQRVLSELVPRLLGVHWSDAIIVSRTCKVCERAAL
ncbi:MAG: hypothetical protein ACOH10_15370 [Rhodoglobus sp.]